MEHTGGARLCTRERQQPEPGGLCHRPQLLDLPTCRPDHPCFGLSPHGAAWQCPGESARRQLEAEDRCPRISRLLAAPGRLPVSREHRPCPLGARSELNQFKARQPCKDRSQGAPHGVWLDRSYPWGVTGAGFRGPGVEQSCT